MTQPMSSRKASSSGIKSKVNANLYTSLEYNLDSTRNSVGLVHPFVLESFFQSTALELSKRKNISIAPKKSSKTTSIRENEEPKLKAFANRTKSIKNIALDPRKDANSKGNVAGRTAYTMKNEVLSTRVLRSAGKFAEFNRELKSVNDFSIENIDWYYEDENYYKNNFQNVFSDFAIPKENRREGNEKLCYTYLLLDSRKYRNKATISWLDFIEAIFYISKGKNDRAFKHAEEAEKGSIAGNINCRKIREIWEGGDPINVFLITENIVTEEAFTREAVMINAMGLKRLCNRIRGSYYGVAVCMKERERLELGASLLIEARNIFRWKKAVDIYPKKKTVIVSFVRPKGVTTLIDPKQSPKIEEPKNRAALNITKNTKNVVPLVEDKKQSTILLVKEKTPATTKAFTKPNSKAADNNSTSRKIIINKTETDKIKTQTTLQPNDHVSYQS